jgi:hypothetical protein
MTIGSEIYNNYCKICDAKGECVVNENRAGASCFDGTINAECGQCASMDAPDKGTCITALAPKYCLPEDDSNYYCWKCVKGWCQPENREGEPCGKGEDYYCMKCYAGVGQCDSPESNGRLCKIDEEDPQNRGIFLVNWICRDGKCIDIFLETTTTEQLLETTTTEQEQTSSTI